MFVIVTWFKKPWNFVGNTSPFSQNFVLLLSCRCGQTFEVKVHFSRCLLRGCQKHNLLPTYEHHAVCVCVCVCVYKRFAHPHDCGNAINHTILHDTTLQQIHLNVVTKIRAGQTGVTFRLTGKPEIFLFSAAPRYAQGLIQPPIKQILILLSKGKSTGAWRRPVISNLVPSLEMHGNAPLLLHTLLWHLA